VDYPEFKEEFRYLGEALERMVKKAVEEGLVEYRGPPEELDKFARNFAVAQCATGKPIRWNIPPQEISEILRLLGYERNFIEEFFYHINEHELAHQRGEGEPSATAAQAAVFARRRDLRRALPRRFRKRFGNGLYRLIEALLVFSPRGQAKSWLDGLLRGIESAENERDKKTAIVGAAREIVGETVRLRESIKSHKGKEFKFVKAYVVSEEDRIIIYRLRLPIGSNVWLIEYPATAYYGKRYTMIDCGPACYLMKSSRLCALSLGRLSRSMLLRGS